MTSQTDVLAWLEDHKGNRVSIQGSCALGRSPSNQIPIPDDRVSRRHALVHLQGENEFWLVDFGSRNGTYLNRQRLTRPIRLHDGDRINIGQAEFTFRQPLSNPDDASRTVLATATAADIRRTSCWLLVADIVGSTRLIEELKPEELPLVTGQWVAECKQTIESSGGRINQFLGDGFFAYWRDRERVEPAIDVALKALGRMQAQARPSFRWALHFSPVVIGGLSVGEEERISGKGVHFAFRMEKLARDLNLMRLLSEPAWERLSAVAEAREAGRHPLPGFDGHYPFYTL